MNAYPEKNVGFLADLLDRFPDASLAVVGDGPQCSDLEGRFAGKTAHDLGYLKGTELAAAYASADAFVYATETETMGNVVLEAIACGCPVVAPRAGGIPSLMSHGDTGLLYTPRNLQDAVGATCLVLSDPAFRTRLSRAVREAVEELNWDHSITRVREVYQEAIRSYQPASARVSFQQRLAQLIVSGLVFGFKSVSNSGDTSVPLENPLRSVEQLAGEREQHFDEDDNQHAIAPPCRASGMPWKYWATTHGSRGRLSKPNRPWTSTIGACSLGMRSSRPPGGAPGRQGRDDRWPTAGELRLHRDAAAFKALMRQHGPMVLGVCRRILGNPPDAEDCFQATFLVLARKAASVSPREQVGNWLYGVARTTAVRAKAANAKRRRRERQVRDMPEPEAARQDLWNAVQPLLDEELARVPDKYRLPVVLCDLEGRPRREVARQLKIPEGTLSSRLTTARRMLAKRLARRGLTVTIGSLTAILAHNAAPACVPVSLVSSTVKAIVLIGAGTAADVISVKVAALAEGVVKAMFVNKIIKSSALALLAVGLVLGMGGFGAGLATTGLWRPPRARERKTDPRNFREGPTETEDRDEAEDRSAAIARNVADRLLRPGRRGRWVGWRVDLQGSDAPHREQSAGNTHTCERRGTCFRRFSYRVCRKIIEVAGEADRYCGV